MRKRASDSLIDSLRTKLASNYAPLSVLRFFHRISYNAISTAAVQKDYSEVDVRKA